MSHLDTIYAHSPVWAQQIAVAVYGWKWYRRRYSHHFYRFVEELESRDRWSVEKFHAYQEERLAAIFSIARSATYYRQIFQEAGIRSDVSPWENLQKIPYLTKEILRRQARDLLTDSPSPRSTMVFKSSGTTGTPTEIYYSPDFHAFELAVPAVRNLGWAGIDYHDRRVMFGVRKVCHYAQKSPPFWRYSPMENMAYASIYHLSSRNLPHYVEFLQKYRPAIIMGYPSSLNTIARFALETGCVIPPAKGIFTTSETVTSTIRSALETVWQCKVYDRYGAVENCLFASQCEFGKYHISPDVGIVEIVDRDGNPCPPGVLGDVICTGLQNTLQPLIRYQIGDMARWALNQSCSCGRAMPILDGMEGRFEDICVTPDGREMLRFDTVFKGVDPIREAQVVQKERDYFLIRVVPADNFNEHDALHLRQNMRLHVGDVKVDIELVSAIERTSGGKFRAVVSLLHQRENSVD